MKDSINWLMFEVSSQEGGENEKLDKFISKCLVNGYLVKATEPQFRSRYHSSNLEQKKKLLLDAYTFYKDFALNLSAQEILENQLDLHTISSKSLIKNINIEFKGRYRFVIKNVLELENKKVILLKVFGKENYLFKESIWKETPWSDYLSLAIYSDRIILKDMSYRIKKYSFNKIIQSILESLKVNVCPIIYSPEDFNKLLKKIISLKYLRRITFISEKLEGNPVISIICRKEDEDIISSLENFSNLGYLSGIENVKEFYLDVGEDYKKIIRFKVEHRLKDIEENTKAITLTYDSGSVSPSKKKDFEKLGIGAKRLYVEEGKRDLKVDLERIMFKRQLNYYEEAWYSKIISKLKSLGILKLERFGTVIKIRIDNSEIVALIRDLLKENGIETKIAKLPSGIEKGNQKIGLLNLSISGENFWMVIFSSVPNEKTIIRFKEKWVSGLSKPPIFIVPKEDIYGRLKLWGDFPHMQFSEVINSFIDQTFMSDLTKIITKTKEKFKEERIELSKNALKNLREIIDKKQSKARNHEFEEGIYSLVDNLFTASFKIAGKYLPDGVKLSPPSFNKGVFIWDAKVWFSDFNSPTEIDKIKRYIITTLKSEEMNIFGGLRKYFFIGHLESYNEIDGMFKEAKKECLKQSKRYKLTKKSINEIQWGYLDFEFFETILGWMNTQKETELGAISFFKRLEDFIENKQIIFAKETKEFIEELEKEIQKIKNTKVNIDSYREIGKEVFINNKDLE